MAKVSKAKSGRTGGPPAARPSPVGLGQLTLVEHALCPLDAGRALRRNQVFETGYYYAGGGRRRQKATVTVTCPAGLSPADEFYLWGLLALTFADCDPTGGGGPGADSEFHATPHFCLRRLGLIDQRGNRGGRQYQQFAAALDRLAQVSYASDAFYDPVRREHRRVRFGFLSYSLPLDPDSSRAWRVAWDPIFFDLVKPLGGQFRFDLETYRGLDPAARRLFLLVSKIFDRRDTTPRFTVEHLAVDVLGFSPALAPRHQRQKLRRVVAALADAGVVAGPVAFDKHPGATPRVGSYSVVLARGSRYARPAPPDAGWDSHSPLWDGLTALGFDAGAAGRLLKEFPRAAVREWLDITVAARERFGRAFFKRSPQAYLVDNLRHALASGRTPPEWWHELRSRERQSTREKPDPSRAAPTRSRLASSSQPDRSAAVLRRVAEAAFVPTDEPVLNLSPTVPTLATILRTRR